MYGIDGNMDPINIPQMLTYIPAPWILWDTYQIVSLYCRRIHIQYTCTLEGMGETMVRP